MAAATLCTYVYYEERLQLAFFDGCFPSCLKSTQASVPVPLPRNDQFTTSSFIPKLANVLPSNHVRIGLPNVLNKGREKSKEKGTAITRSTACEICSSENQPNFKIFVMLETCFQKYYFTSR